MKFRRSIGALLLGTFFILNGIYFLGVFYTLGRRDWDAYAAQIHSRVQGITASFDVFEDEGEQRKLKESGNLEEFVREREALVQGVQRLGNEYIAWIPGQCRVLLNVSIFTGFVSLVSGAALMARVRWATKTAFLSLFGLGLYYIANRWAVYPVLRMIQFVMDGGHRLNLLVDPAYTDVAPYAGGSALAKLLFGFPFVWMHAGVLFLVTGVAVCLIQLEKHRLRQEAAA